MSLLSAVTDAFNTAANFAANKTETEKKLDEALSKANWGAPSSLLRELAAATFDSMEYPVIMREVWASLNHAGKNWRQIFKGLVLLEALIKNGSERVVDEARDHLFRIRTLNDFTYHQDGSDKGAGVREKSKQLVELLNDNQRIREERDKSRQLRDKYIGISNAGAVSIGGGRDEWDRGRDDYRQREPRSTDGGSEWERNRGEHSDFGDSDFGGPSRRPPQQRQNADADEWPTDNLRSSGTQQQPQQQQPQQQQGRRGRKPAGGARSETDNTHVASAGPTSSDAFETAFGATPTMPADDFDAFGTAAPPVKAATSAPSSAQKLQVNIKPGGLPAKAQTKASAQQSEFDPFHAAATASSTPANTSSSSFDPFAGSGAASASPPQQAASQPASSVSSLGYDPFAAPPRPTPAAVIAAAYGSRNDPFSSQPAPFSGSAPGADPGFGSFSAPPAVKPKDVDVDRLVSLDGLSLGDQIGRGQPAAGPAAKKSAAPLKDMSKPAQAGGGQPTMQAPPMLQPQQQFQPAPAAAMMGGYAMGAGGSISAMGPAYTMPMQQQQQPQQYYGGMPAMPMHQPAGYGYGYPNPAQQGGFMMMGANQQPMMQPGAFPPQQPAARDPFNNPFGF